MSNGMQKTKTLRRRARRANRHARQAVHVARVLGREIENAQVLVIAMLAQAGGRMTFSRGTLNQIVNGEVPHEFEVINGEHEGERVVQFKQPPAAVVSEVAPVTAQ